MSRRLIQHSRVSVEVSVMLTEDELAALEALAGYGADAFLTVFYERLGAHYLRPHEAGLRSLFVAVGEAKSILVRARKAREAFAHNATETAP